MARRVLHLGPAEDGAVAADRLRSAIDRLQAELGLTPNFSPEVEATARAAAAAPRLPELDRTDIEFVTIDPPGAKDLDQALHIESGPDGYLVHYAIADVAAFITPDDPVDQEARRRGETLYGADAKIPLHPPVISEDAGSLLPDRVRPALLWTIQVDADGEGTAAHVERALIRSRAQLDYAGAQRRIDDPAARSAGQVDRTLMLLREVGELRSAREAARGGVNLPLPEQEIVMEQDRWRLRFRTPQPVEEWNAQISLLTGMAAASLMVYAGVGVLRTLPAAEPRAVARLHRVARALDIAWPAEQLYPDFIRSLDPTRPRHAAMLVAATQVLRGASYAAFDGDLPAAAEHAALASEYAHVTAPLRRLVDRYASEICVAISADEPVPDWVLQRLPELPEVMRASGQRAGRYQGAIIDLLEAAVLAPRVGEVFSGVVVEVDEKDPTRGELSITDPAIEARVTSDGPLPLGETVPARLIEADPGSGLVRFTVD